MSLKKYREKRNFKKTKEPAGKADALTIKASKQKSPLGFVIQKHAASHLHYDFRLEMQGVLKSWAVPKGPSLDPNMKRLAVEVEDHPLEYGEFEGIIPQGEYGGGTVMLWDKGTYQVEGDPYQAYKKGDLTLQLQGEKLKGIWKLIKMKSFQGGGKNNWLLFKVKDEQANEKKDILKEAPLSVLTRRSMNEIAEASNVWNSNQVYNKKNKSKNLLGKKVYNKVAKIKDYFKNPKYRPTYRNKNTLSAILEKELKAIRGLAKRKLPNTFKPQLAKLTDTPPLGDNWLHEIKFDGYRILARHNRPKVQLLTRNGLDWSHKFPNILEEIKALPLRDFILDGELIATDPKGVGDFQKLQNYMMENEKEYIKYYVFDLPFCNGYDLRELPLLERKRILNILFDSWQGDHEHVAYTDHIIGHGDLFYQGACQLGLEGSLSKKIDSAYENKRSSTWLKNKCNQRQEFVIAGYTEPQGARKYFGSLVLGLYNAAGTLIYCGHVGTGFSEKTLKEIFTLLKGLKQDESPFKSLPRGVAKRVTWLKPKLVCEVEFFTRTSEGSLRHPAFVGLRLDKKAKEVKEEVKLNTHRKNKIKDKSDINNTKMEVTQSENVNIEIRKSKNKKTNKDECVIADVKITHPDKIFSVTKTVSKRQIAEYYDQVSEWILPHIAYRPLLIMRCPSQAQFKCFFQKHHKGSFPKEIYPINVEEPRIHVFKSRKKSEEISDYEFLMVKNKTGLISLVQFDVLEIHPWGSQSKNLEKPDRIIFDMDPDPEIPWKEVLKSAVHLREELQALGLQSFLKISGGKGLHLMLPIVPKQDWTTIKNFTQAFAQYIVQKTPEKYIATISKKERKGKIFLDYLRNSRGATAVAAYSTRAREAAPISMPMTWSAISKIKSPDQFNVENALLYLKKSTVDPWKGFFECRQTVTLKMIKELKDRLKD